MPIYSIMVTINAHLTAQVNAMQTVIATNEQIVACEAPLSNNN